MFDHVKDVILKNLNILVITETKHKLPHDIEGIFIELSFRKIKQLLSGTLHPQSQNHQYYFETLGKVLDSYSYYNRVVLAGDFNSEEKYACMETIEINYGNKKYFYEASYKENSQKQHFAIMTYKLAKVLKKLL